MSSNVEVPALGESITEAVLVRWLKKEGDRVAVDEPLCELESDKATVDLPAPVGGILHPQKQAGETAHVGEVIAQIDEAAAPAAAEMEPQPQFSEREPQKLKPQEPMTPVEKSLEPAAQKPTPPQKPEATPIAERKAQLAPTQRAPIAKNAPADADGIRRVAMSKIRRSIAERMVWAQQSMAMLTTFNEIDMTAVQELRSRHQERFKAAHGFSLGLVSLFAWASARALKQFPILNAQLDGPDIVYYDHVNLGVAVSTERGLVVPVLHNVESWSLPRIEAEIKRVANAAREGKLSIHELSGGTFTITNGGIFGSLLSTPILNPPQTGILGLHVIQDRPVAIRGQVHVRPMMYVALTYDHRLADGQDAVSFLVRLKQVLEDPIQMLLEI
jgi:2-oxoglutarate dehydrogenase E2 component (dihydrolipoamide succinyltransferase)